jgi:hypothetical protein
MPATSADMTACHTGARAEARRAKAGEPGIHNPSAKGVLEIGARFWYYCI